jgi:hypothetical protein
MKTLKSISSEKTYNRAMEAVEGVKNGGKFNGTVYSQHNKKGLYFLHVYVNGEQIGLSPSVPKDLVETVKAEFLAEVSGANNGAGTFNTNCGYYGTAADAARGYDGIE